MKHKKKQKEMTGDVPDSKASVAMEDMKQIMQDSRFAHVPFDRKLRHMRKEDQKVKLDSRFASMFTDEKFYEKATMDPRGRTGRFATKENLHKFYRMSSDESESDDDDDDDGEDSSELDDKEGEEEEPLSDEADSQEKEDGKDTEDILERLKDLTQDYARGTNLFSEDSSDDDSSTDDDEDEQEFEWGELDQDAVWDTEQEVEETSRLALCNLDWANIKAVDIMVLLNSFCPRGGSIKKVSIYPSEFGKERMAEEDQFGPKELTSLDPSRKSTDIDDDVVNLEKLEKGKLSYSSEETKNYEALRRYERNRLRYYYAVVECDSVETAITVYKECDGQSFEMTGVNVDLRYIPNDMDFEEEVHDTCDTVPEFYNSKLFMTTALLDSQPTLTWDQTDPHRKKVLSNAMESARLGRRYDEDYIKNFIAEGSDEDSDSVQEDDSSSEDDDEKDSRRKRIAKFRALIEEIDDKERKKKDRFNMEAVFGAEAGENDTNENGVDTSNEDDSEEEEEKQLNPFEKFLEKKKKKRKEKKVKSEVKDSSDDEGDAFSDDEIPNDLKNDPFFAEELKEREEEAKRNKKSKKKKKGRKQREEAEEEEDNEEKTNLELLLMDEDNEEKKHFSMRDIIDEHKKKSKKSKKKKKDKRSKEQEASHTDDFKVDTSDPRFSNLFASGDYNIDPSHPQFKRTKAVDELISNVQKKRVAESFEKLPEPKRERKEELELSMLVKKVKGKTKKPK